jgi:DNA-binding IclR family transcriptional regulator
VKQSIQAVQRAIDVLSCFGDGRPSLTVADVAAKLNMNRSTAWRYLTSLSYDGMILALDKPGEYALGPKVLQLADVYTAQWSDLVDISRSVLSDLRNRTGETAALHVRRGWSRIVVAQVESQQELHRTYRDLGQPIPLHVGAPSIAILAFLEPSERATYVDRYASSAEGVDADQLSADLAKALGRGYATSEGSRVKNIASVAAPILDGSGTAFASVNITGPSERLHAGEIPFTDHVIAAAHAISRRVKNSTPPVALEVNVP